MKHPVWRLLLIGLLVGGGWYVTTRWEAAEPPAEPGRYPSEYGWLQRTFPHFDADADAYRRAFVQAQGLRSAAKSGTFGAWEPVGPTNIGGRISDVEFNPVDPRIVYAAAATGGVFKSTNSGQTWAPVFDDQPVLSIGDIAVDPVNPEVLYVGTGEANGGHNNFAGTGVYKSTDAGATWSFSGLPNTASIGRVLVDPHAPSRVFVAAIGSYFAPNPERGVYRSLDGGASWQQVLGPEEGTLNDSTGVIDLVMRPDSSNVLFAAAWQRVRRVSGANLRGPASGIYKSTDSGETWTRLTAAHGLPDAPAGRIGLAICRDVPTVIYALYTDGFTFQDLYRSNDGGETWFDADPDDELEDIFPSGNFSWYFGQIRVAPDDPNRVYVMDVQFMQSDDGGLTWNRQRGTHVDHHALAFHPVDPSFVINGNDGGLALSQDGGQLWQRVFRLPVTQFYEIGLDPSNPNQFYGGTQDNGTLQSDGPNGWQRILGGDGFYVIVDPRDPGVVYAERQFGALNKLVDGRATSATNGIPSSDDRNWSTPVAMDPNNPDVLYYGTTRLYRTENAATSWTRISPDLTAGLGFALLGTITTIAVAPTNSNVIYLGTDDGKVWVTPNYGTSWIDITGPLPQRWVTRVVVDPSDENTAYATFSGLRWRDPQPHVFRTRDQGQTWEDITANLPDAPVNAFAIDPRNTEYLYLGSDVGAFVSTDDGASWEALGEALPAVSVYDMKVFENDTLRFLVAGTHGRSMYTLDLAGVPALPTATEADVPVPAAIALEPGYPNPFAGQTTLTYRLAERAEARLEVFDILGRRVATLFDGTAPAGTHTALWDAEVAPGTYIARLTVATRTGPQVRTATLTRVR